MPKKPCPGCARTDCKTRDTLPACRFCGQPVKISGLRCEDCFSDATARWPGDDRSVTVASLSRQEREQHTRRQRQIMAALA